MIAIIYYSVLLNFLENIHGFDTNYKQSWQRVNMGSDYFYLLSYLNALQVLPKSQNVLEAPHTTELYLVSFWGYKGKVRRQILYEKVSEHKVILIRTFFFFFEGLSVLSFDILFRRVISFKPLSLKKACSLKCAIKECKKLQVTETKMHDQF